MSRSRPASSNCERHFVMLDRGHGHAGRIELQVSPEQRVDACEDGNPVLLRRLIGACRVGLDSRNQRHAHAFGLKLAQHTQVVAPEGAGAGHSHS